MNVLKLSVKGNPFLKLVQNTIQLSLWVLLWGWITCRWTSVFWGIFLYSFHREQAWVDNRSQAWSHQWAKRRTSFVENLRSWSSSRSAIWTISGYTLQASDDLIAESWRQNEAMADNYWLNIAEVWSASGANHSILCQRRFETLKEVHLVISDCYKSVTDHWTEVDWTGLSLVPRPRSCSFLSCKRQKAGQGLGTRLDWTHKNVRNKSINHRK